MKKLNSLVDRLRQDGEAYRIMNLNLSGRCLLLCATLFSASLLSTSGWSVSSALIEAVERPIASVAVRTESRIKRQVRADAWGEPGDSFGFSLSVDQSRILIGAPFDDAGDQEHVGEGMVYARDPETGQWVFEDRLSASQPLEQMRFGWQVSLLGDVAVLGAPHGVLADGAPRAGTVHAFDYNGSKWIDRGPLAASDSVPENRFGNALDLGEGILIVGAPDQNALQPEAGAVYVFEFDGITWSETAKLVATDGGFGDNFGESVALDGDRIAIGASRADTAVSNSGAVYIFERSGASWFEVDRVVAPDGASGDRFGEAVALREGLLLVGAPGVSDAGDFSGSAYLYSLAAQNWEFTQELVVPSPVEYGEFGDQVHLSGNHLIVGAPGYYEAGGVRAGAVFEFEFDGSVWTPAGQISLLEPQAFAAFGIAIDTSPDQLYVGASGFDIDDVTGAVIELSNVDGVRQETSRILATDTFAEDRFGHKMIIDAGRLIVGVIADLGATLAEVYHFDDGQWVASGALESETDHAERFFGGALALEGQHAAAGAPSPEGIGGGVDAFVQFYEFDGTSWMTTDRVEPSDAQPDSDFGYSISISDNRALIGAPRLIFSSLPGYGNSFIFQWTGAEWIETHKLEPNIVNFENYFGTSVSLDGDRALIAAPGDGSVFVFEFDGANWNQTSELLPPEPSTPFGRSVFLQGNRAYVAGYSNGGPAFPSGAIHIYEVVAGSWVYSGSFGPPQPYDELRFASSFRIEGNMAIVKSLEFYSGGNPSLSSAALVHIFEEDEGVWHQRSVYRSPFEPDETSFGSSISLHNDMAFIGTYGVDIDAPGSGAVYVQDLDIIFEDSFHPFPNTHQ